MRIIFFVIYPEINAGSRYRVYRYLPYLEKAGIAYRVCPPVSNTLFRMLFQTDDPVKKVCFYLLTFFSRLKDVARVWRYDCVFIQQGLWYPGPPVLEHVIWLLNKNIIYDTDDADFAKPVPEKGLGARLFDRRRTARLCRIAKEVIVSVPYLLRYADRYHSHVTVIPTSIDMSRYAPKKYPGATGEARNPLSVPSRAVVIGWAGTASGLVQLKIVEGVLRRLSARYSIVLRIICSKTIALEGISTEFVPWSLDSEIEDLQGIDIGIMPLPATPFAMGKAGFKLIQYMGVGLPVVTSPVGINRDIVHDGDNGFLAENDAEWEDKLSRLIRDPGLRMKMGLRGRETVRDRYSIERHWKTYIKVIRRAGCRSRR